jgi:asparagine synthase (glutamine-hydrolysing)
LRYLLEDAIKIRMHSDVPLGIFLSGGIDSSSIVSLASRISGSRLKTFSISGGGGVFNELPFARIMAKAANTEHSEFYVNPENIRTLLPKLISFIDEPFADSSIIPTYYVSKISREKVTVALSGEGGDEVFGGYPWYKKNSLVSFLRSSPVFKKLINLSAGAVSRLPPGVISSLNYFQGIFRKIESLNMLCSLPEAEGYEMIMQVFPERLKRKVIADSIINCSKGFVVGSAYRASHARDRLNRALYADLKTYLPGDLLTKVDRMSMSNSLEVRAPFLDHRIIEFAAKIHPRLKVKNGLTKYILRRSMSGLVPDAILNRRIKRGFSVPVGEWFRGEVGGLAQEVLLDPQALRRGIFSKPGIEDMLKLHRRGVYDYGHQIWTLLVFELWARQYT